MEHEIVHGLRVDPAELAETLGHDPGEPFLLAGLALLEQAVREARDDRWWHALPDRLYRHLEAECGRALAVIELGVRLQRDHADYLHELTHGTVRKS